MRPALKTIRRLLKRGPVPPLHPLKRRYPLLRRNIFIVTYGRSGSTLLQSMLNTIPGCQIPGENHNALETVFASYERIQKTKTGWGRKAEPQNHPWHGADLVQPQAYASALVEAFAENVLAPDPAVRYFGFKEIRYDAFGPRFPDLLAFMRAHFLDPVFVFNTRNIEDVVKSAWWKTWKEEDVRKLVGKMDGRFADYHAANPDHTVLLRYEDFSADPAALRPIFDMLNEPFDLEKLAPILEERLTH